MTDDEKMKLLGTYWQDDNDEGIGIVQYGSTNKVCWYDEGGGLGNDC